MLVFREETFGPVAPVRVVPDFETALAEAADDRYGLAATVLTPDVAHAELLDEMTAVKVVHWSAPNSS